MYPKDKWSYGEQGWSMLPNYKRKKKTEEKPLPTLEQAINLESHDGGNRLVMEQATSTHLAVHDRTSHLIARFPAKKWWDFISKIGEITLGDILRLSCPDFNNGTLFVAEVYLKPDQSKKKDSTDHYLNMNFSVVTLKHAGWVKELLKLGGHVK